jgi:hypothetical protein
MPLYLDTSGRAHASIAICGRCSIKRAYDDLRDDPNAPGLKVCIYGCIDQYDPWRLPARATEDVTLQYPRPDTSINNVPGYAVTYTPLQGTFMVGEVVWGLSSKDSGTLLAQLTGTTLQIQPLGAVEFAVGEIIAGATSSATGTVTAIVGSA